MSIDPLSWCCDETGNVDPVDSDPFPGGSPDLDQEAPAGYAEKLFSADVGNCRELNPYLITAFIKDFLVRQWSSASGITHPANKPYAAEGTAESPVVILGADERAPATAGSMPRLIIKRNEVQEAPIGFAGQHMGVAAAEQTVDKGATRRFSTQFVGSHTIFCSHTAPLLAELLSTEVLRQLVFFRYVILEDVVGLKQWVIQQIGRVAELNEADNTFVVPVTIAWAYEVVWELTEHSLPLADIRIK